MIYLLAAAVTVVVIGFLLHEDRKVGFPIGTKKVATMIAAVGPWALGAALLAVDAWHFGKWVIAR
ncbi:MAG: hypothetical protein JWO13_2269 [Acidobacteriales bacterium]|nr:hypothetical protein [Terriglobales bacterium]